MGQQENAVVAAIADSVYLNGKIYTVNEALPWAEAIAIQGDRLIFVGSDDAVRKFIGASTSVIDLEQRMVMPGIHDAHTHLLWASMHMKCDCCFASEETID
ncbi:MAG: amidohydrolase, partial [Proteobacteria bacterium]|nr:amidohydrolase [Pseudomonadota bacterium]